MVAIFKKYITIYNYKLREERYKIFLPRYYNDKIIFNTETFL